MQTLTSHPWGILLWCEPLKAPTLMAPVMHTPMTDDTMPAAAPVPAPEEAAEETAAPAEESAPAEGEAAAA